MAIVSGGIYEKKAYLTKKITIIEASSDSQEYEGTLEYVY